MFQPKIEAEQGKLVDFSEKTSVENTTQFSTSLIYWLRNFFLLSSRQQPQRFIKNHFKWRGRLPFIFMSKWTTELKKSVELSNTKTIVYRKYRLQNFLKCRSFELIYNICLTFMIYPGLPIKYRVQLLHFSGLELFEFLCQLQGRVKNSIKLQKGSSEKYPLENYSGFFP